MKEEKKESPIGVLWGWGKPYHGKFIGSVILAVLGVACQMVPYFCVANIVTMMLSGEQNFSRYVTAGIIALCGYFGKVLFSSLSTTISHTATYYTLRDLRENITAKLARVPMGTILDTPSGQYKTTIVDRVEGMESTFAHLLPEMTANVLVPLVIVVYLFVMDWRMALLSLVTLVVGLAVMSAGMKNYPVKWEGAVKAGKQMTDAIVEYIGGIEVVKAFSQSAGSYKKYSDAVNYNANYYVDWMRENQKTMSAYNAILPSVLICVLPCGFAFWLSGSLELSTFLSIVIFSLGLIGPIIAAFTFTDDLAVLGTNVEEISQLLNAEELNHKDAPVKLADTGISLRSVSFSYDGTTEVLHDVNLAIHPGTMTALVGPSGSGKSTVAKLIAGYWDVTSGSITLGGHELKDMPLSEIADQISYVSQDNYLFNRSIRENIRMGRPSATDAEVEQAAKQSGCDAFIRKLDNGYDTVVGSAGSHLSGGERQRIAIARAMLKNAPVVILDEATAYIDPENEALVQKAISTLTVGKTLIVIAHRLSTIVGADNIVVVKDGTIHAQGTHEKLLETCPPLPGYVAGAHRRERPDVRGCCQMYGTLKKIFAFAGSKKGLLKKSLLFSFLSGLFSAMQFAALFVVIGALVSDNRDGKFICISLGIMAVSLIGRIITTYFSTMEQTETGYCMVAEKRIHIGDRLRYIPMGYFNKNSIGNITAIVTTTLGDVENSAARVLVSVLGGFFNSVALVIVLLVFDWRIGLVAAAGVLIYLAAAELALRKSAVLSGVRQHTQESLVESVLEYIQGMGIVKAFGLERDSTQSIGSAIKASCRDNLKLTKASVPYDAIKQAVVRVFSVLLLLASVWFWLDGSLSLAYGLILVIASFMVFNDLENAGNMASLLQMLAASMDTANSIDDTPVMDEKGADITPKSSEIVFDKVDFSYADRKILDQVSFTIPEKTTTAIVGPSGAGKTTMCNLIARFWDVNAGKITIGGTDVRDFKLDSLMKNISMVFQSVYLFADTIENNIKFGCPDATHEQVVEAAKKACCHDFISALPDGYDTVIGEGGGTLSGGEKQRISIARAMLKDAPIIILDEATSSVDPENEDELQRAIEALTHDKTIIMIAHRLKTVRNADQILVLDNAHIVQRGTHAELIQQKGLYADFVSARQEAIGWKLAQ